MAVKACEYGAVTSPFAKLDVVMDGPATTVRDNVLESFPPRLSVTLNVIDVLPSAVGVPLIKTVDGASDRPAGNDPEVMLQV